MLLPSLIRAHCTSPKALDKATAVNVASRPCKIRRTAIAEPTSILNIVCKVFVALFVNWLENAALAYHAVRPKIPVVKTARKMRKPVCASVERRVVRVSLPSMGTEVVLKVSSAFGSSCWRRSSFLTLRALFVGIAMSIVLGLRAVVGNLE